MSYSIKEIFYTLQGEGAHSGRPAVFCRFAGCNLWSGHEKDRPAAKCQFCDTDFVGVNGPGGGRFETAAECARAVEKAWPGSVAIEKRFVVCTGGEPLLQMDDNLIAELHARRFEIAVETNGTVAAPADVDWICVSPKAGTNLVQRSGDELKLVYPQIGAHPRDFETLQFHHFYLQPMDGPNRHTNTDLAVRYCLDHPKWRLSLQTHKFIGIP
jgi:7-carboxy-7-deazaguanine synthase (Cx14CxxC type)